MVSSAGSGTLSFAGTYLVSGKPSATAFIDNVVLTPIATVTLGNLSQTYDGAPEMPTVSTSVPGLALTYVYTGTTAAGAAYNSSTPPTAAGTYTVTATISDPVYAGSASGTFTICERLPATVTLSGLTATYDGTAHSVTAATNPLRRFRR